MYVHMLKLCSVELPRALGRLHLLAKPVKHAKIHQLRQEPPYACHCLRPCTRAENPRERQLTMHGKDETGSRGKAFRNACRRPKHRRVGERVDLLLRDKHDKMDEMFKVMVPMSTGQSNRTSPETSPKPPSAGPR